MSSKLKARPKRCTLSDVASLSGVSPSLVSKVLSGRGDMSRFSSTTVERVRRMAKSLHYRPTMAIRMLRENRSMTLGIALPGSGVYAGTLLPSAIEKAGELGYELIVNMAAFGTEAYLQRVSSLLDRNVDGVIVFARASFQQTDLYREMLTHRRPTVFVEHDTGGREFDFIGMDDLANSRLAVNHLKRLGHRKIAFVYEYEGHDDQPSAHQRRIDFEQAVDEAGLPILPRHYLPAVGNEMPQELGRVCDPASGVTAVVVRGYERADWVCQQLNSVGIRVPDDISVLNITAHSYARERLRYDSVYTAIERIGRRCIEMLVDQIENPERPARREGLPGTLIPGETCRDIRSSA